MSDHGEWHGRALCKLTKKLLDKNYEVYSECMTPDLEFIELGERILGKTPGKLGISLFVGNKSLDTRLSKPDMVIVKDNKVQHIVEVEESKNPIEIAGLIVATRVADLCDINSEKVRIRPLPTEGAILHILFKDWLSVNVRTVIDDVIDEKVNLLDIKIMRFEEFIENMDGF